MIFHLKRTDSGRVFEILDKFNLPPEFVRSTEVQLLAKEMLIAHLGRGLFFQTSKIIEKFYLSRDVILSPDVQFAAKKLLISCIKNNRFDDAIEIRDILSISSAVIQSQEVQSAVKERVIRFLEEPKHLSFDETLHGAIEICGKFDLQLKVVQSAAMEAMIDYLNGDRLEAYFYASQIFDEFNLSEEAIKSPEAQSAVKKQLIEQLRSGRGGISIQIRDKFNLISEVVLSPDVQSAAQEGLAKCYKDYRYNERIEEAKAICNGFNLPPPGWLKDSISPHEKIRTDTFLDRVLRVLRKKSKRP